MAVLGSARDEGEDGWLLMRKSFLWDGGHQALTSLCSLEMMNLLAAAPEKTTVSSPSMFVMKTSEKCFWVLCLMKSCGVLVMKSRVSPMRGQPEVPGGRFTVFLVHELLLLWTINK